MSTKSPAQTPDPWQDVQPFKLMLLSDLQSGATEATLYHVDDVDRARAAEREQHQREIAQLEAENASLRNAVDLAIVSGADTERRQAETIRQLQASEKAAWDALHVRDQALLEAQDQIATLTQERDAARNQAASEAHAALAAAPQGGK